LAVDSVVLVVSRGIQVNSLVISAGQTWQKEILVDSLELWNLFFNCKMGIIMLLYLPEGCLG